MTIEKLSQTDTLQRLTKATGKWGMYIEISCPTRRVSKIPDAAPYLNFQDDMQLMADGKGFILCDTEAELYELYKVTVGDDVNPHNSNKGPAKVYALTCGPDGVTRDENT